MCVSVCVIAYERKQTVSGDSTQTDGESKREIDIDKLEREKKLPREVCLAARAAVSHCSLYRLELLAIRQI